MMKKVADYQYIQNGAIKSQKIYKRRWPIQAKIYLANVKHPIKK
jgi:hypothetical protein